MIIGGNELYSLLTDSSSGSFAQPQSNVPKRTMHSIIAKIFFIKALLSIFSYFIIKNCAMQQKLGGRVTEVGRCGHRPLRRVRFNGRFVNRPYKKSGRLLSQPPKKGLLNCQGLCNCIVNDGSCSLEATTEVGQNICCKCAAADNFNGCLGLQTGGMNLEGLTVHMDLTDIQLAADGQCSTVNEYIRSLTGSAAAGDGAAQQVYSTVSTHITTVCLCNTVFDHTTVHIEGTFSMEHGQVTAGAGGLTAGELTTVEVEHSLILRVACGGAGCGVVVTGDDHNCTAGGNFLQVRISAAVNIQRTTS